MKTVLCVAVLALSLAGACNKSDSSGSAGSTTAASNDTGVAECDTYISKMEACLSKMDPTAKSMVESGFKTTRAAWKQTAANPQTKGSLQPICKQMLDAFDKNNPMCK
jgi:hypothetical protein